MRANTRLLGLLLITAACPAPPVELVPDPCRPGDRIGEGEGEPGPAGLQHVVVDAAGAVSVRTLAAILEPSFSSLSSSPGALGDVDDDGTVDLVFTAAAGLALAKDAFAVAPVITVIDDHASLSQNPRNTQLVDLDDDGDLDLVIAGRSTVALRVYPGDAGGFLAPIDLVRTTVTAGPRCLFAPEGPVCFNELASLVVADLDDDDDLDLAFADGGLAVFLQGPGLTFEKTVVAAALADPRVVAQVGAGSLHASDVDGDGFVDLVVGTLAAAAVPILSEDASFLVFAGAGDGSFGAPIASAVGAPFAEVVDGGIADLDGDSLPDAVTCAKSALDGCEERSAAFHAGVGDGTFAAGVDLGLPCFQAAGLADVNGDGVLDFFTANGSSIALGALGPTFARPIAAGLDAPRMVGVVDSDDDGASELLIVRQSGF
ncbi:MAG: VCBS repeat-containing protein [Deltaproteobacteria bacterium]|nr:VCBS repeat-containing protein [Deltaproteobacteria bacterium]